MGPAGGGFITDAAEEAARAEFQRAARILLTTPLVGAAATPDEFRLVRRHVPQLRDWFATNTGWRLTQDSAVIRLTKQIVPTTATAQAIAAHHPAAVSRRDAAFSARRYVLFCLAAAALERADAQTTLGNLAEDVVRMARERELGGLTFAFETREERSDLAQAIRLLLRLGAINRVSGDEDAYVHAGGDAALYDVERRVLARLLAATQSPARIASRDPERPLDIAALEGELHPSAAVYTEADAHTAIRRRLTIQLLEDPVCYVDELSQDEASYLTRQRVALTGRITELTGLEAEIRAEGIAMTDPEDQLTDQRMPEVGTDGHVALLIAEHLSRMPEVTIDELHALVTSWAKEYKSYWRVGAREASAAPVLVRDAIAKLEALGLVRRNGPTVKGLAAIGRFRFTEPRRADGVAARRAPEASLFDAAPMDIQEETA
jgi:uncharacterized protein (TIGR02678 family)